jgi:hypothetical protein
VRPALAGVLDSVTKSKEMPKHAIQKLKFYIRDNAAPEVGGAG